MKFYKKFYEERTNLRKLRNEKIEPRTLYLLVILMGSHEDKGIRWDVLVVPPPRLELRFNP